MLTAVRALVALLFTVLSLGLVIGAAEAKRQEKPDKPNAPNVDVNGCGPERLKKAVPEKPGGFNFHEACNEHDRCYQTKGKTKKECDDEFKKAMYEVCKGYKGPKYDIYGFVWVKDPKKKPLGGSWVWQKVKEVDFTETTKKHCELWADAYYNAVVKFGDDSYKEGQKTAKEPPKKDDPKKEEPKKEEPKKDDGGGDGPAPAAEPAPEPAPAPAPEAQPAPAQAEPARADHAVAPA